MGMDEKQEKASSLTEPSSFEPFISQQMMNERTPATVPNQMGDRSGSPGSSSSVIE